MAPVKNSNPRNPTVEDESETASNDQGAEHQPVSWAEIFSQHESNLKSHLEILHMVKGHVVSESEAFRTILSMLDRTRELMEQLEAIRKKFMPNGVASDVLSGTYTKDINGNPAKSTNGSRSENAPHRAPSEPLNSQDPSTKSKPSFVFDSRPTPVSLPGSNNSKMSRKRSRIEEEEEMPLLSETDTTAAGTQKRQRTKDAMPGGDEHVEHYIPVSMETEDISEEVERRLKLKEERRRKRHEKPEKKRKRESVNSNGSFSPPEESFKPKKKKVKVDDNGPEEEVNGNSGSKEKGEENNLKRSASHRFSSDGHPPEDPDYKAKKRKKA